MSSMQWLLMGLLKHFLLLPVLDCDCCTSLCHFFCYTLFLNYFNFSPRSVRFKIKVSKNSRKRYAYMNVTCWLVRNITVYIGNHFTQEPINASVCRPFFVWDLLVSLNLNGLMIFICLVGFLFYHPCLHFRLLKSWCVDSHPPFSSSV